MSVIAEKRDIMEAVGVAIGTSDLSSSELRETSVDLVAAVGAASARLHYGDASLPINGGAFKPSATPADQIAAELAPMLWHLHAGGQEQTALRVSALFGRWLESKAEFQPLRAMVPAFSRRVVHEWLYSRCAKCKGSGLLEIDRRLGKVAPRSFARNARLVTCGLCNGSRLALPNHQFRAEWLGIARAVYDDDGWYRRFKRALVWLDQIARRLRKPLQIESGRRRIAPQ